jgi:hypothetical protein
MKSQYFLALGVTLIAIGTGLFVSGLNEIQSNVDNSKIDSLETIINKQDSLIKDLESQVDTLLDECQMKEAEISYWGQKYDSLQWK